MNSFYGGLNGQSFEIKEIFTSKNGLTNSLVNDLSKGWTSPISVGEFVVVSYGMPNDENYNELRKIDLDAEAKGYNSTLWRKEYDEEQGNANGLYYRLIASMTGNTPHLLVEQPSFILDANEDPRVIYDGSNIDLPVIQFCLPKSQVLQKVDSETLNANELPQVVYDDDSDSSLPADEGYVGTINNPMIRFKLPQSQVIEQAVVEAYLDVNQNPEVMLDIADINRPILKFKLPVAQQLLKENVSSQVLDADAAPYIEFDTTNPNAPTLVFYLPQSQVMETPETIVADPVVLPIVSDIGTINNPKLQFTLPKAVQFYYGSLLGERTAGTYTLSDPAFADYSIGDYYINAATGFIYRVITKSGEECTFEYIACIQSPLPDITATSISPYGDDLMPAAPQVSRRFTNSELTAWALDFKLPTAPTPAAEYAFVGASEEGSVTSSVTSPDIITFNFQIPAGSKIFSGTDRDNDTAGAKPGDIYLNSETGEVYELAIDGIWNLKNGTLKGPVGDSLKIVREYQLVESDTLVNTFENTVAYIEQNYVDEDGNPLPYSPEELFAVTWTNTEGEESSYWYFYTAQGAWARASLTGGLSNFLATDYVDDSSEVADNKAYSVGYVNKLIGDTSDTSDADKTTFSKNQIHELISWGTWEDAIAGN